MRNLSLIIVLAFLLLGCKEDSVTPVNHNPEISSVVVFPEVVKPSDSLIVVCNASDPDGDSVVYDWYTSGSVIRIKGGMPGLPALFNTYKNTQIFYAPDSEFVSAQMDSFYISCVVRDGIGGQSRARRVYFKVIH